MTYRQPAEWAHHQAMWSAWPSHENVWLEDLAPARAQLAALFTALADAGEQVHLLVDGADARRAAETVFTSKNIHLHDCDFGDIWLRDTAPIFVATPDGIAAQMFHFNGWGGKYILPGDEKVSATVAKLSGVAEINDCGWVLEGGSVDVDGTGWALTTAQCLLHENRNPNLSKAQIVEKLRDQLGIHQLVWLGDGLANDHTDGHIDNLARFIAPGVAIVPEARDANDPNAAVYLDARKCLIDAGLEVVVAPSVGLLENEDGDAIPASYMNFIIANEAVIVPIYGTKWDDVAIKEMEPYFPGRRVIGLRANHILTGGGSFHCITQQVPAWPLVKD
jgi:agmatine deiminase